jgi:hypothetical protein
MIVTILVDGKVVLEGPAIIDQEEDDYVELIVSREFIVQVPSVKPFTKKD